MKTKSTSIINKNIKYKNISSGNIKEPCVIEYFLSTGRVPPFYSILNSKSEERKEEDKKKNIDNKDYVEIERPIEGTTIVVKERLVKIIDIVEDISRQNFEKFEEVAKANSWSDEQQGLIYFNLILGNQTMSLTKNSYKILKKELLSLKYPKTQIQVFKRKLELLKQNNFKFIKDYYEEIKEQLFGYALARDLTKKEIEHCELDFFLNGLGRFTSIKVAEQNLHCSDLKEIFSYLQRLEEGILMQQKDVSNDKPYRFRRKEEFKKYCDFCKTNTHNFVDCFKKPKDNNLKELNNAPKEKYCSNCRMDNHDTEFCYKIKNREVNKNLIMINEPKGKKNETEVKPKISIENALRTEETNSKMSLENLQLEDSNIKRLEDNDNNVKENKNEEVKIKKCLFMKTEKFVDDKLLNNRNENKIEDTKIKHIKDIKLKDVSIIDKQENKLRNIKCKLNVRRTLMLKLRRFIVSRRQFNQKIKEIKSKNSCNIKKIICSKKARKKMKSILIGCKVSQEYDSEEKRRPITQF